MRGNRPYIPLTPSASHVTLANESILNCLFAEQCLPAHSSGKGTVKFFFSALRYTVNETAGSVETSC